MPSEHLAQSTNYGGGARGGSIRKTTCAECRHTIQVVTIDGRQYATDTELLTVITDRGKRTKVHARRLHDESCARLARSTEKDRLRKEQDAWAAKQPAKQAKQRELAAETIARTADDLRREYLTAQAALRRLASRAGAQPKKRTRGM